MCWSREKTGSIARIPVARSSRAAAAGWNSSDLNPGTRRPASSTKSDLCYTEIFGPLQGLLVSTATSSLNLRALLKTAIARSGLGAPARIVSGPGAAAKALLVAAAAYERPHGVVLYVVPSDGDIDQAAMDVGFFLASLEGLSTASVERAILPFPSHEVDPYRGLAPHVGVTSARARALHGLASGGARVVISSAAALLPRVSAPSRLKNVSIDLRPGQDVAPTDLAELLVDAGFGREDPADQHGEFAIRGGILDVFPAGDAYPVRLEFVGDTIESLRTYDPATQRSIAPIDQLTIVPLKDVLGDDRAATLFDFIALAHDARIIVSERDEVETNATKLLEQLQHSYQEAVRKADEGMEAPASPYRLFVDWTE